MASMLKVTTADIESEERALEEEMKQRTHQIMLLKLRKKIGEIETMVNEGNVTFAEAKAAFKVFTDSANSSTLFCESVAFASAGETKTTMVETGVAVAAPTKEEIAAKLGVRVDQIVCHI